MEFPSGALVVDPALELDERTPVAERISSAFDDSKPASVRCSRLQLLPLLLSSSSLQECGVLAKKLSAVVCDPKPKESSVLRTAAGLLPILAVTLIQRGLGIAPTVSPVPEATAAAPLSLELGLGASQALSGATDHTAFDCAPPAPLDADLLSEAAACVCAHVIASLRCLCVDGGQLVAAAAFDAFAATAGELACLRCESGNVSGLQVRPDKAQLLSVTHPGVYHTLVLSLWGVVTDCVSARFHTKKARAFGAVAMLAAAKQDSQWPGAALDVAKFVHACAVPGADAVGDGAIDPEQMYLTACALHRWPYMCEPYNHVQAAGMYEAEAHLLALHTVLQLAAAPPPLLDPSEDEYETADREHRANAVRMAAVEAIAPVAMCCTPHSVAVQVVGVVDACCRGGDAPIVHAALSTVGPLLALLAPAADIELLRQDVMVRRQGLAVCADAVDRLGSWLLAMASGGEPLGRAGEGGVGRGRVRTSSSYGTRSRTATSDSAALLGPSQRTKRLSAAFTEEQLMAAVRASDPSLVAHRGVGGGWLRPGKVMSLPPPTPPDPSMYSGVGLFPGAEVGGHEPFLGMLPPGTERRDLARSLSRSDTLSISLGEDEEDEEGSIVTRDVHPGPSRLPSFSSTVPARSLDVPTAGGGDGGSRVPEEADAFSDSEGEDEGEGAGARSDGGNKDEGEAGRADTILATEDVAALWDSDRSPTPTPAPTLVDPERDGFELAAPVRGLDSDIEVDGYLARQSARSTPTLSLPLPLEAEDEEFAGEQARVALMLSAARLGGEAERGEEQEDGHTLLHDLALIRLEAAARCVPAVARALVRDTALSVRTALASMQGVGASSRSAGRGEGGGGGGGGRPPPMHVHRHRTRALLHFRLRLVLRVVSRLYRCSDKSGSVTALLIAGLVDTSASLVQGIAAIQELTASIGDGLAWAAHGGRAGGQRHRPVDSARLGAVLLCVLGKGLGRGEEETVIGAMGCAATLLGLLPQAAHGKLLTAMLGAARVRPPPPVLITCSRKSMPGLSHLYGPLAGESEEAMATGRPGGDLTPSFAAHPSPGRVGRGGGGHSWSAADNVGWRVRAALAAHLPACIPHLECTTLATVVVPTVLTFVTDPVACIRTPASHALAAALGALWYYARRPARVSELGAVQALRLSSALPPPLPPQDKKPAMPLSPAAEGSPVHTHGALPLGSPTGPPHPLPAMARPPPVHPPPTVQTRGTNKGTGMGWLTRWLGSPTGREARKEAVVVGSPARKVDPPPAPLPLRVVASPLTPKATPALPAGVGVADTPPPSPLPTPTPVEESRTLAAVCLENALRALQMCVGVGARHPHRVAYITLCRAVCGVTPSPGTGGEGQGQGQADGRWSLSRLLFDASPEAYGDSSACLSLPCLATAPLAAAVIAGEALLPCARGCRAGAGQGRGAGYARSYAESVPLGWGVGNAAGYGCSSAQGEGEGDLLHAYPDWWRRARRALERMRVCEGAKDVRTCVGADTGPSPLPLTSHQLQRACLDNLYDTHLKLPLLRLLREYRPDTYWWRQVAPLAGSVACAVSVSEWGPALARERLELHLSSSLRRQRWAAELDKAGRENHRQEREQGAPTRTVAQSRDLDVEAVEDPTWALAGLVMGETAGKQLNLDCLRLDSAQSFEDGAERAQLGLELLPAQDSGFTVPARDVAAMVPKRSTLRGFEPLATEKGEAGGFGGFR